jgi:DNA-binding transcriptional LysR family regulator
MRSNPLPHLLTRLKLRQLALVLALEETHNLHRAAQSLNLSQPAATKLLREIEAALGVPLFERHSRGMTPTVYGVAAARHARLVLIDLGKLHQDIQGLQFGIQGTLRLGSIMAAVPELIPETLAIIAHEQPTLSIALVTDTSDGLLTLLQSGRLDVMVGRVMGLQDSDSLRYEPLVEEELRLIVRTSHPLLSRPSLTLPDLAAERWVLQPEASPMRRALAAAFTLLQLPLPQHPIETSSMLASVCILARTDLIAAVPASVAAYFVALGAVRELPLQLPTLLEPFGLITIREHPVSPALSYLLATLRIVAHRTGPHPGRSERAGARQSDHDT